MFGGILQALFTTHLLDPRLDLLYMVVRMVAFADDSGGHSQSLLVRRDWIPLLTREDVSHRGNGRI